MTDAIPFLPDPFSGRAPLFPLPNVVLLPGAALPLHIFEPRYRAMTKDALEGERLIAMAAFEPGWEADYEGNPPIRPVVCLGAITNEVRLPDGRYHFVLVGLRRARVTGEVSRDPYRLATVDPIDEREPLPDAEIDGLRRTLLGTVALARRAGAKVPPMVQGVPLKRASIGALADLLGAILPLSLPDRLGLLEELDPKRRADAVIRTWSQSLETHFRMARAPGGTAESPN